MFQVLRVPSENVASVWRANWLVRVCDCVRERKCMCARACASVCVMCVRVFACIAYAFIRFVWCVQRVTERVINPTVARGACMWWGGCTGGRLGRARVSERMLTDGDGRVCTKATAPCGFSVSKLLLLHMNGTIDGQSSRATASSRGRRPQQPRRWLRFAALVHRPNGQDFARGDLAALVRNSKKRRMNLRS